MSKQDTTITVNGHEWPKYSTFRPMIQPNDSDEKTLDGSMYTDFINNRIPYVVGWDKLTKSQWDVVFNDYMQQYQNEDYVDLEVPAYGVSGKYKIVISGDPQIKYNGVIYQGVGVTLEPEKAIG